MRRRLIILLIIVGIIIFAVMRLRGGSVQLETAKVTRQTLVQSVDVSGKIESKTTVDLAFPTSERLIWLGVQEGDTVLQYQAIAALDKAKLEATFRQAQQDFIAAKAEVEKVYDETKRKVDESFDEKIKRTAAEAKQNKAFDNMKKAEADLQNAVLISPIAGVVVKSDVQTAGVQVTAATTITIADPNKLVFTLDVDETDVSKIKKGQVVKIILDAYPDKTLEGKIERIAVASREAEGGGTVFEATVTLPKNDDSNLRIGMNGDGEIVIEEKKDVLVIPNEAIVEDDSVFVVKNGRREKRTVTLGSQSDVETEVIDGLSEGDIVIANPQELTEGQARRGFFRFLPT